ncbi:unnamed protein product [Polarella glacialis]|uniref:RWD domain-containing protein n=2 Tax=Polarella glacialis TaxID=89957 RepID=A0A813HYJ2_POLGL|nr:unnamed protein product [Polarella glacialis]
MALLPDIAEEVEVLRAIYGDEAIRIIEPRPKKDDEEGGEELLSLEVDLQPMAEDGTQLVWVTLFIQVPAGYPSQAVPQVEVKKSRGIGDVAIEAMMEAAKHSATAHGLQEIGCLAPVLSEIKDALGKAVSECSICMMDCDAGESVFVACGCVFHQACLDQWRGLKDKEKSDKADGATTSIKAERDSLIRQLAAAEECVEEAAREVSGAQTTSEEAIKWAMTLQKRASAAAGNEDDEEEVEGSEEGSDEGSEEDDDDDRNESKWGAPEVSIAEGWGKCKKKNYKPSTTKNRKRPRKYLNRIEEKLEEMKKDAKITDTDEVREAVRKWEKATFELKEAKAILEKTQDDEKKAQEKAVRLAADVEYMNGHLREERAKFTSLPLLCPVCQNDVDDTTEAGKLAADDGKAVEAADVDNFQATEGEIREAAERDRKLKVGAAQVAAVEDKLLFMMSKGAVGKLSPPSAAASRQAEVLCRDREEEGGSDGKGRGNKLHATKQPKSKARKAQTQKTTDEELMETMSLLMEAYGEDSVDAQDLLDAFSELMEVLSDKSPTDREMKEVLAEMIETLHEDQRQQARRQDASSKARKKISKAPTLASARSEALKVP